MKRQIQLENKHSLFNRRSSSLTFFLLFGLVAMLLVLAACTLPDFSSQKPKENCNKTADPTDKDVEKALNYTGKVFQTSDWKRSYTVGDQRVSLTWDHNSLNALAYMEYLVWDCGYTQADLDSYFSESNFKNVFFSAYQNPVELNRCKGDDGLSLYEIDCLVQLGTRRTGRVRNPVFDNLVGGNIRLPTVFTCSVGTIRRS
jgi:hypothetical protein